MIKIRAQFITATEHNKISEFKQLNELTLVFVGFQLDWVQEMFSAC